MTIDAVSLLVTSVSLAVTILSLMFAVIQTVKLQRLRRIRDNQLRDIWTKQKNLSWMIIGKEDTHSRGSLCSISQDIEKDLARLIATLSDWKSSDLDNLMFQGKIDDHDKEYLQRIL